MGSWNSYTPKGFRSVPHTVPVKSGGSYTSGSYNKALSGGGLWAGWLVYQTVPYGGTGKDFYIDFATIRSTLYFNLLSPWIRVSVRFYSVLTGLDSNWYVLADRYPLSNLNSNVHSLSKKLWDNYKTYGNYRPAYGIVKVPNVDPSSCATYQEYWDKCVEQVNAGNASYYYWDTSSDSYRSFVGRMPLGIRYISNNGKWAPNKNYVDPNGVVKGNYYSYTGVKWSFANEDGGNTPSNYKHLVINEDIIRAAHGTVTGVTAFQLRISFITRTQSGENENAYWLFGCPNTSNPEAGDGIFTMIDNPQLGLLDYGPAGASTDWPPRFDAKAYYIDKNGQQTEIAAQAASQNGSWGLF